MLNLQICFKMSSWHAVHIIAIFDLMFGQILSDLSSTTTTTNTTPILYKQQASSSDLCVIFI